MQTALCTALWHSSLYKSTWCKKRYLLASAGVPKSSHAVAVCWVQHSGRQKTPATQRFRLLSPACMQQVHRVVATGYRTESLAPSSTSLFFPASSLRPPATSLTPPATSLRPPASSLRPPASSLMPPATSLRPPASSLRPPATSLTPPASSLTPPETILKGYSNL